MTKPKYTEAQAKDETIEAMVFILRQYRVSAERLIKKNKRREEIRNQGKIPIDNMWYEIQSEFEEARAHERLLHNALVNRYGRKECTKWYNKKLSVSYFLRKEGE